MRPPQRMMEMMGNQGTQGTLKPRGRSGWLRRRKITPKETRTKAKSVPMLERSAASPISTRPEGRPTARPAIQEAVPRHGEPDARLSVLEDEKRAQHAHERADDDDGTPDGTGSELLEGVGDGSLGSGALAEDGILHHAEQDERHADVEDGADDERGDDSEGNVFLRILGFLGGGGDGVKADVGEENDCAAGEDAAESGGCEGNPVGFVDEAAADDEKERDGGDLDGDHGVVDLGGFTHAADEQQTEDHDDEEGRKVEVSASPLAVSPDWGGPSLGEGEAELRELSFEVSGKAYADGDVGDGVLEDEIPADDPGEDFAEGSVAVGIG